MADASTSGPTSPRAEEPTYFDDFAELFDRFTRIWDGISGHFADWVRGHG